MATAKTAKTTTKKTPVLQWVKANSRRILCIVLCVVLAASLFVPALQGLF